MSNRSMRRRSGLWKAHLVKALDKAETIIQHNQGINPPDFDYKFNLQYGSAYFREDGQMAALRARLEKHIMQVPGASAPVIRPEPFRVWKARLKENGIYGRGVLHPQ